MDVEYCTNSCKQFFIDIIYIIGEDDEWPVSSWSRIVLKMYI